MNVRTPAILAAALSAALHVSPTEGQQFRQMCGNGEYLVGFTAQMVPQWVGTPYERTVLSRLQVLCAQQAFNWSLGAPVARGTPAGAVEGGTTRQVRCTGDLRVVNQIFVDRPFIVMAPVPAGLRELHIVEGQLDGGYYGGVPTVLATSILDCKTLEPPHAVAAEQRQPTLGRPSLAVGATACDCTSNQQAAYRSCSRSTCGVTSGCAEANKVAVGIQGTASAYVREFSLVCAAPPSGPKGVSTEMNRPRRRGG